MVAGEGQLDGGLADGVGLLDVHLRGDVPDLQDAENAEAVAGRVPGLKDVVEELSIAEP